MARKLVRFPLMDGTDWTALRLCSRSIFIRVWAFDFALCNIISALPLLTLPPWKFNLGN